MINYVIAASIEGPVFNITKVNRLQMGAYLCIASNGVPPTVSKRIMLVVHCKLLIPERFYTQCFNALKYVTLV